MSRAWQARLWSGSRACTLGQKLWASSRCNGGQSGNGVLLRGTGTLTSSAGTMPTLGADLSGLQLSVVNVSPSILRVTIGAPGRYTIPQDDVFQNTQIERETPAALSQLLLACWGWRRHGRLSQHL